jgi:hypothetical protein
VSDFLKPAKPLKGLPVPPDVQDKTNRGREAMLKDKDIRRVCVKFFQNEPYWYVKARGGLGVLSSALDAVDKQNYRVRNKYNFVGNVVAGKVSAASQRVPGYEIDPSSSDPEDIAQARIAQQVAFWGHDKWRLRRLKKKVITNSLVQREGFAMPYFDPNVGPYKLNEETGKYEGAGDLKHLCLSRGEVMWEPGLDFEDSPWYGIERAVLPETIERIPGFVGGTLSKDAKIADTQEGKTSKEMVCLTEYLERPCPKYPDGRRIFIANSVVVADYRKSDPLLKNDDWWEPYPYFGANGEVVDEPVIHRLSYVVDPEGDDRGLVEEIIDLQRTILDCWNKLLEYKNRALHLQMIAPRGSNMERRQDGPGVTYTYNVVNGKGPEWERLPDPGYVGQLAQMLEMAKADLRTLASDFESPQDLTDVSGKSLNAAVEQARERWASYIGDVAEWDSRYMRHCLALVATHFSEERIIEIRGTHGWEPPKAFTGQDLPSQVNVRVLPGSIESKSRESLLQEIQMITSIWGPEAIRPEMAVSAIHSGNPEGLFRSYDLHKARAWSLVQKIRMDPVAVLNMPPRGPDLEMGAPEDNFMLAGWLPKKQDNLVIWKQVISDYMIEPDFEKQPPEVQEMFDLVWLELERLEQRKMMLLQAQQIDSAAQLGAMNAAAPQGTIASPQPQSMSPEQAQPETGTPQ